MKTKVAKSVKMVSKMTPVLNSEGIKRGSELHMNIKVDAYVDKDNLPTCAIDFNCGKVCKFYRTQRMGFNETCVFAESGGSYTEEMERRGEGTGTLIPVKKCPIWNVKE